MQKERPMKLIHFKEGFVNYQPDPYIIKAEDGKYYVYSSSEFGVNVYRADTLFGEYEWLGKAFYEEGKACYWAPSVIYLDGKYYMYVSFVDEGVTDMHEQTMHVCVSDAPEGPFKTVRPIIAPFSIDSHVVKSGEELYIFYSINDYEAERAGTYIVADRMLSPTECEGKPKLIVRATLDEEIFMKDRFRKGQHWHTLEGAFYFREGNDHYVIYSGNCYESEYYYLGYAHAYGDTDDILSLDFKKQPSDCEYRPLIARNEFEAGTGHCSVIKENGEYYCVYHGRDIPPDARLTEDSRTARICKLIAKGKSLTAERSK